MAIKLIRIKLTANVRCFADNAVKARHVFAFLCGLRVYSPQICGE